MYHVERDKAEFRGTGGVLKDLAGQYDDDDLVLVANAAQLLIDPLSVIAAALDHKRGDISLISHQDGTPSGVMLVRCKTLQEIAQTGFVDMKEQALPLIAQKYDVKVMHCRRPSGLPIRSLRDYIAALKHYHRRRAGKPSSIGSAGRGFVAGVCDRRRRRDRRPARPRARLDRAQGRRRGIRCGRCALRRLPRRSCETEDHGGGSVPVRSAANQMNAF